MNSYFSERLTPECISRALRSSWLSPLHHIGASRSDLSFITDRSTVFRPTKRVLMPFLWACHREARFECVHQHVQALRKVLEHADLINEILDLRLQGHG